VLAKAFRSFSAFRETVEEAGRGNQEARRSLLACEGIGEVVGNEIVAFMTNPLNRAAMDDLLSVITPIDTEELVTKGSPVQGKTVVCFSVILKENLQKIPLS
jgi:NAD-dependent DNA ligase